MRILLIHRDRYPWATTQRAQSLKREWVKDEVDIAYAKELPNGDKYDVIHFLYSGGISKSRDYILKHKNKVFTTLASQRTLDLYFDKLEPLKEIYKQTICCVCQNPDLVNKLRKIIQQDNVIYIPNGVDEKIFNCHRSFVVGCVAAKQDYKDHKGLNLIKQACAELDLELMIATKAKYDTMPDFYREIDCLVNASISEGCNNPTLEALAMNIPVISTDVGIVEELKGITIIKRNVESIKDALKNTNRRAQILEKYTWKKISEQYRQLYVEKQRIK
uniref:Putative glycosyltransferase n=1 Tax=viral metagenome TaxID=1070528 RepID=A0A6M3K6G2_9ZZZZ